MPVRYTVFGNLVKFTLLGRPQQHQLSLVASRYFSSIPNFAVSTKSTVNATCSQSLKQGVAIAKLKLPTDEFGNMTSLSNKMISTQTLRSAVIRYYQSDERFELKLVHNGKVFNFDRLVKDSVQTLMDRMKTNITKKFKNWNGSVILLISTSEIEAEWNAVQDTSVPTSNILNCLLNGSRLNIQVDEQIYDVCINPPEIFSIKFLKQSVVGFPIVPYKIDASKNFHQELSRYSWEYTTQRKAKQLESKKKNKKVEVGLKSVDSDNNIWISTECSNFIFTPEDVHVGARLRMTCTPSNGLCLGLPFSEELPETVIAPPVTNPIYMERLARITNTSVKTNDSKFFRIVSYNCLAECYATEEWFIASPKNALAPDFRLPFLCKELSEYQGDIYCLQEVDAKHFERQFEPFFQQALSMHGVFSSKIGNVKEGVCTFYNPKKIDFIKSETVVIHEHMKTLSFWNGFSENLSTRLEGRNSVLQVSVFRANGKDNQILIVGNTHLYFHPDADHIRLLQTITCVDYMENIAAAIEKEFNGYNVNVLFCGDFNCTPPFSSYRYLTTGKIEQNDFDWTSHPTEKITGIEAIHNLKLKNAHPSQELTNITTCFEGCLDYILYQPKHFKLLNSYPPPSKELLTSMLGLEESRLVSLPNYHTPSDHLPIIADFLLSPETTY